MGQSLAMNYIHIVFSTKYRQPLIDEFIEEELFSYLGGICNNFESMPFRVGGYLNHVHIVCSLSKKVALSNLVGNIKSSSSKWIKTKGDKYKNFYWQDGYGAFSVNPKQLDIVVAYVANQKEHHRKKSFEDEYLAFLKKYKMPYDVRYVWD